MPTYSPRTARLSLMPLYLSHRRWQGDFRFLRHGPGYRLRRGCVLMARSFGRGQAPLTLGRSTG